MEPQKKSNRDIIIKLVAGIVVLSLAGFGFSRIVTKSQVEESIDEQGTTATTTTDITTSDENSAPMTDNRYRNGSYSSTGMYTSPAGQEEIMITLVIENDMVVRANFVGKAENPGSVKNQALFNAGFNKYVVGKNIDSLSLQVVNGSSLTPKGFMDALSKIKLQAQA